MRQLCVLLQLLAVYGIVSYGNPVKAPFIEPCKPSDSACVKSSTIKVIPFFVAGIPELGVGVSDPIHFEKVDFDVGGLKFKLENGMMKGLKNVIVDRISMDVDKKVIDADLRLDSMTIRGHYVASGQVLILPIRGDGDFKLKNKDVRINVKIPYAVVKGPDGKDYMEIKPIKHTHEVVGNAHFTLTNLFDGNKQLSEAMHKFLNESWVIVSKEFGGPFMNAIVNEVYKNVKALLGKIPMEELIL